MRKTLWLISLAIILSFSVRSVAAETAVEAAGPELNLIYPFMNAVNETLVLNPLFQQSFLDFLKDNSVQAVLDSDGFPLIYFSGEPGGPRFGCEGFCPSISMNNYTFGSKALNLSDVSGLDAGLADMQIAEESMVVGSDGIENSIGTINAIRSGLSGNPRALADFERYLLGQQEGSLRGTYYDERYNDVWDYAVSNIEKDPGLYNSILNDLRMNDIGNAAGRLDAYLQNNFDINGAFDMESMYSALENGQIGDMQTEEFMRNVLERIAETENMDSIKNALDNIDLENFSDLLKREEFGEMMKNAGEMMKNNPEMFDKLGDLAREMVERPETRDVFKEALKEAMKNADAEAIKDLMDAFSKMENKEELMKTLMEGVGEYMREMVESGQMEEMMKQMDSPAMRDMMAEAAQEFSQSMLESMGDWAKNIPIEFSYVVALIAIIVTLLILLKLKL